jgi:hypothetical protein
LLSFYGTGVDTMEKYELIAHAFDGDKECYFKAKEYWLQTEAEANKKLHEAYNEAFSPKMNFRIRKGTIGDGKPVKLTTQTLTSIGGHEHITSLPKER